LLFSAESERLKLGKPDPVAWRKTDRNWKLMSISRKVAVQPRVRAALV